MSFPVPKEVSAATLWQRVTALPRPSDVVDFPRKDDEGNPIAQVLMRVLTQAEVTSATANAERFARQVMAGSIPKADEAASGYEAIYQNDLNVQLVYLSARQVDDQTKPFFPSQAEMRTHLTPDEIGALVRAYVIVQAERGPMVSQMTDGDFDAWVAKLKEGGNSAPLASLSLDALRALVKHLVSALPRSQMDSSLPGTPSQESAASDPSFDAEGS